MANVAKRSFLVPTSIKMAGYDDRKQGNIGTHDKLFTKALTIDNGLERFIVITNDLLCVDDDLVKKVTEKINENEKIDEKNIFICASHTHGGPEICQWKFSEDDFSLDYETQKLRKEIIDIIADNAIESLKNLVPVEIGFGNEKCSDVACNRIDKDLPSDCFVNVIELRKFDKSPLCILVNYTCHPTVMGAENLYITADYPGELQKLLEDHFSGQAVAMFINGACGNQSTRFTRRSQNFDEVGRMGNIVYESTIKALNNITDFKSWIEMKSIKTLTDFPQKKLPSYDEAIKVMEKAKMVRENVISSHAEPWKIRKAITKYQGAVATLELIKHIKDGYKIYSYIQLMQLGDILIVGVPVELFVEYGIEIKKISKYKNTIIAGYTNNMLGYVYTPESYHDCDYEAWSSPFGIDTGKFVVETVKELMSLL